jgi:peptide/nickel transport system permease protein
MNSRPLPALPGLRHPADRSSASAPSVPPRRGFLRIRLFSVPSLLAGLAILGSFAVLALVAVQHDFSHLGRLTTDASLATNPYPPGPSLAHPFGEMSGIGIDEFSSLLQATPWDLAIFIGILGIGGTVGAILGGFAGLRPGLAQETVGSVGDLLVAVPPFFLVWVLVLNVDLTVSRSLFVPVLIGAFAAVLCFHHARGVLSTARIVATRPYVEAARAAGARDSRILFRHVLPNSLSPVWAQLPVDVFSVLFLLTVFPYVGCLDAAELQTLGTFGYATPFPTLPFPEWGTILASGVCYGLNVAAPLATWWMWVFPLAVVVLFAVGIALTSEGLQRLTLLRS